MSDFIEPEMGSGILDDNFFRNILDTTRKWAKFLSILGFIGVALMGIFAMLFIAGGSLLGSLSENIAATIPTALFGVIYLIIAIINFFPAKYLYDFSSYLGKTVNSGSESELKEAFTKLKSFFKFYGIFAIIVLGFYVLAFLGGLGTALLV